MSVMITGGVKNHMSGQADAVEELVGELRSLGHDVRAGHRIDSYAELRPELICYLLEVPHPTRPVVECVVVRAGRPSCDLLEQLLELLLDPPSRTIPADEPFVVEVVVAIVDGNGALARHGCGVVPAGDVAEVASQGTSEYLDCHVFDTRPGKMTFDQLLVLDVVLGVSC